MEYMIVDRTTLDIKPITDQVLREVSGANVNEVVRDGLAWSNELVLHVIELKTNGPARDFTKLPALFQHDIAEINRRLEAHNARLMPTAAHPWMDPYTQMHLWPYEYNPIYEAYDRIFNCKGHG